MKTQLIFTNHPGEELDSFVAQKNPSSVFVICDNIIETQVLPVLSNMSKTVATAQRIVCQPGDSNKNLDSVAQIWQQLNEKGATRSSLIINVGGGMVTDMGGFAAATFKRGVSFVNLPTSLLAAADASVGGKTGINFNGYKNEVGAFAEAELTIISTLLFHTLPHQELLSGYAEMLKHGLIESRDELNKLLSYSIVSDDVDDDKLLALLENSVGVKSNIVELDPLEQGPRKALNLGHTVGHAFESLAMKRNSPIPHGYAVAWGIVVELVLSNLQLGFPSSDLSRFATYVKDNYGAFMIDCDDYPELLELMAHDKKNSSPDSINFTLLSDVGQVKINCSSTVDQIKTALDIYRDLMGI